jgi:hypothetical protein
MKGIIRFIKKLFGIYESGYEYWVHTKDININPSWKETQINRNKLKRKMEYWFRTGEFESQIILDKNFNLIDGYSSSYIAESNRIDKVPVYFVD